MKLRKLLYVSLLSVFLSLAALGCKGQVTTSSFPEKDIKFIIPYGPGGGFDAQVRILIPYWEKYLPNQVKIIPKNVPGAASIIGVTELYNAKPDGLSVGIMNIPGMVESSFLQNVDYDLPKMEYIGVLNNAVQVGLVSPKSRMTSFQDLVNRGSFTAAISTSGIELGVIGETIGVDMKLIAHGGSAESILSAIRGDSDFVKYPFSSVREHVESGALKPIVVFGDTRFSAIPDVPTIVELGYPELVEINQLTRVIATSPDVPDDVMSVLRESFAKAQEDPEFIQKMKTADPNYTPGDHEMARKTVENSIEIYSKYEALMKEFVPK